MKMSAAGFRRRCGVLFAVALCLALQLPATARADCLRTNSQVLLDLSRWTTEQIGLASYLGAFSQGPAQWLISEGGTAATQTLNADASVLVSPFILNNERIEGRWMVNTNYDDDFIGFVFGYQDARHFYVFDWKQAGQQYFGTEHYAEVGMSVKRLSSEEPLGFTDLFVTTNDPPRVRLLYHNSIPYEDWTEYGFSLQVEPGAFFITVTQGSNELARISIQDTNYTPGRFGFYNLSQDQVRYAGFTRVSLPLPPLIRVGPAVTVEGRAGDTYLRFPVELTGENCKGVSVDYQLRSDTATEGQDYPFLPPGRLTFPAGVTNLTVSVPINGDCEPETDEWVWLVLTNAVNGVLEVSQAAGVILNDDPGLPPAVSLDLDGGAGCVLLPSDLRLAADAVDPDGTVVRVDFRLEGGALLGSALVPPYALTWTGVPPGRHLLAAVAWDDCGLARTSATVVVEAQSPPGLTVDDPVVVEGSTGTVAVFTVTLTSPSCREVSVGLRTEEGTARVPSDFLSVTQTLVLRPGETSAVVMVPVVGDDREEPDEAFLLLFTDVSGAFLLRPHGMGTIVNDDTNRAPVVVLELSDSCLALPADLVLSARAEDQDGRITHVEFLEGARLLGVSSTPPYAWSWRDVPAGTHVLRAVACDDQGARSTSATVVVTAAWPSALTLDDHTVQEGDGEGMAVFTLRLTPASCRPVEVLVWLQDGSAVAGADHLPVSVPVLFAPGETAAPVRVPILGDRVQESTEVFLLCLTNPVGAVLGRACAVGTIIDDDVNPPAVELEPMASCLPAGSDLRLAARASDPDGRVTQVEFLEGTNLLGRTVEAPHVLLWSNVPPGPLVLRAVATDDFGSRSTSAAVVVSATLPSALSLNDCTVVEGDGPGVAIFTVNLVPASCRTVQVSVVTQDRSALAGSDYLPLPFTLTFPPGQTSASVAVPIRGDSVEEPDETFLACLVSPVGATLSRACGVGTILNDDTNRPPSVNWGALADCVILPADITLRVEAEDPDGSVRGVYYYFGETNLLGQVGTPPYELTWSNVPPGVHRLMAVAEDDFGARTTSDVAVVTASLPSWLAVNDRTVVEGNADSEVLFTVSLLPASCREVTLDVLTVDATAWAGWDYRPTATRVTFAPGQTSAVVAVTVIGDAMEEPDEFFQVCLTNAFGAGVARACGQGTILNDDRNLPPVVAITSPAEGAVFSTPPGYVAVQAAASDVDGVVTQVQFYANGQLAGTRAEGPYAVLLGGLAAGPYTLVATAVDDRGLWATSAPVRITVRGCDPALAVAPLGDQSRCVCDEVVFTAQVTTAEPVSIRWYANGTALAGQTNATLRLLNLKAGDAGLYTVEVESACARVTRSATLSLKGQGNANPVSFTNAGRITIFDNSVAGPYPSVLPVECVPGPIKHVWVTLAGLSHNFPDDVDILLAGPSAGGVVPAVRLLSDAGGGDNVTNLVLTFTDTVTNRLPNGGVLQGGVYAPTDYETPLDSFALPAPAGVTATNFSPFLGRQANGAWSLYVRDDLGGDGGSIGGGWRVMIEWEDTPPRLESPVRKADGTFEFVLTGLARMTHVVEASEDLVAWRPVSTNVLSGPTVVTIPPDAAGSPQRFFRALRCP